MTSTRTLERLLWRCFLIPADWNLDGNKLGLRMSSRCCLYIPGLRPPDVHLAWRGLRLRHRMAGPPGPDLLGLRPRPPAVDFFVFLFLFTSELVEAIRSPDLGLLVPGCIREISRLSFLSVWGRLVFVTCVCRV